MSESTGHVTARLDDYLHGLLTPVAAARVTTHLAACPACQQALEAARQRRLAVEAALPPREPSPQLVPATLRRIESSDQRRRRLRRRGWGALAALAASVLVLALAQWHYATLKASPPDLEVFGQNDLLAGSPGSLRVRLTDHHSRAVLAGVPIHIALRPQSGQPPVELATFTTDARGTGQPSFTLPDWADGRYDLLVTAEVGGRAEELAQSVHLKRSAKVMLSSDKPVYQPGQDIQVRALTLRQPSLRPVVGGEAVFRVIDPKGNVIFKQTERTSAFGIAAAHCPLATAILEGPYTLRCQVGDTESSSTVEVKRYVLPKFKLSVELDQDFYQPGQTVRGKVKATYFHGQPVAGGQLAVEARSAEVKGEVLAKYGLTTDANGEVALASFELPTTMIGRPQDGGDARFTLTAALRDTAGQEQTRTVSRVVTARALRLEVIPEDGTLVRGVANTLYLYACTADGRPAPAKGTLTIGDSTRDIETNQLGVATLTVTPDEPTLTLEAWVADAAGRSGQQTQTLSCGGPVDDFLVRTDKAVYDGGETLHLSVLGGGNAPVFVDFLKEGQTVRTETVEVVGGRGELAFDLPPELAGTLQLCAYRFKGDGVAVRKTRVLYVRPAAQLRVGIAADKPVYRPGETAKLNFTLTDPQGRPTPGAVSLAVVDEAVFSVLEQMPGMERTFYLLEQDLLKPVTTLYPWSPDADVRRGSAERDAFEQALFARTARTLPTEGGGGPALLVGPPAGRSPHSLALSSFGRKVQQVAATQAVALKWVTVGWCVLLGTVVAVGYVGLWLLVRANVVVILHIGAASVFFVGMLLTARLGQKADNTFTVVGSVLGGDAMERSSMAPASPMQMNPIVDASGSMEGAPGSPVRVRELFPETLFWRPELVTDDSGRASLDLDLADSITNWQVAASAVTADGRLGGTAAGVRVFQPFFVDLNLPVALTRGDEAAVPVVVSNYLAQPLSVDLQLADADWFERAGPAAQRVELKPNEVKSVAYRLRVKRVGSHQLQVTARGQDVADAVKRSIEVVPDGRRIERVVNGSLHEKSAVAVEVPDGIIDGSAKAFLKVYPSGFSQVVDGLDGIFQMPHGCFEQTSSTTYPNVLALDYLRRTHKSAPAVEAKARQYIHLGYQRLIGFEVNGGGFDWFGRGPANVRLTAYGLMEFRDMAAVHDVDPRLIERTRNWLLEQRHADGSWGSAVGLHPESDPAAGRTGDLARLSMTAYVAWSVYGGNAVSSERGTRTQQYLFGFRPDDLSDPYLLALVCNALLAINPQHRDLPPYLDRLLALRHPDSDSRRAWWALPAAARTGFYGAGKAGSVETTALAALALIAGGRAGQARPALAWLLGQKDAAGTWYSTQATVLALKALLAGTTAAGDEGERRITLDLAGRFHQTLILHGDQAEVMQQIDLSKYLKPGSQTLTLTEQVPTGTSFQVAYRYHVPEGAAAPAGEALPMDVTFDRDRLRVGEGLTATVTVTNRQAQEAAMVMLDLPLPAGFALDRESLDRFVKDRTIEKYQTTPRQAIVYLRGLKPNQELKLAYHLKATMPVTLTIPAGRAYEYYDPDKRGRGRPRPLTVVAQ